jgi:hypothetical protein
MGARKSILPKTSILLQQEKSKNLSLFQTRKGCQVCTERRRYKKAQSNNEASQLTRESPSLLVRTQIAQNVKLVVKNETDHPIQLRKFGAQRKQIIPT